MNRFAGASLRGLIWSLWFVLVSASSAVEPGGPWAGLWEEADGGYLEAPAWLLDARVVEGTLVLVTDGDPEKRAGRSDEDAGKLDRRHWVPRENSVGHHALVQQPELIDASGGVWFRCATNQAQMVRSDGESVRVFRAEDVFIHPVAEDDAGRVVLSERTGVWIWRDGEMTWHETAVGGRVPPQHIRRHEVFAMPGTGTLVVPRLHYNPVARQAAKPLAGFALLFSGESGEGGDRRISLRASGVRQVIPQPDRSWFLSPELRNLGRPVTGWVWIPSETALPPELRRELESLGADAYADREAAAHRIFDTYRSWQGRLQAFEESVADLEVRMQLGRVLNAWGKAAPLEPVLPENAKGLLWELAETLRESDAGVAYQMIPPLPEADRNARNMREVQTRQFAPPHWSLVAYHGNKIETLVQEIPPGARPGRLPFDRAGGHDLLDLGAAGLAVRCVDGAFRRVRDGKLENVPAWNPPAPAGPPMLADSALIAVSGDWLIARRYGRLLALPTGVDASGKPVPPPAEAARFLDPAAMNRLLREASSANRTVGMRAAGKIIERNPHDPRGYQSRLNVMARHPAEGDKARMLADGLNVVQRSPASGNFMAMMTEMGFDPETTFRFFDAASLYMSDQRADQQARLAASRATRLYRLDEIRAGIDGFARAHKLSPSPQYLFRQAAGWVDLEDLERALELADEGVEMAESNMGVYLERGRIRELAGDIPGATEDYDRAVELAPDNAMPYHSRGTFRFRIGAPAKDLLADLELAHELDDNDPEILNNLAWFLSTYPDDELRDGKRAVRLATQANRLRDSKADHILDTLAAAHAEAGDFKEAIRWQKEALDVTDDESTEIYEEHLRAFEDGKPVREGSPDSR